MGLQKTYSAKFERVWKEHRFGSKEEASKAFAKLRTTDEEDNILIERLREEHKYNRRWLDGVIVHLSTYLNQRRWQDDYPRIKPAAKQAAYDKDSLAKRLGYNTMEEYEQAAWKHLPRPQH